MLLKKNEYWINSNHFHKFSNILVKLERINERKYYMQQIMSTTTTTTTTTATKRKFRFTRRFMLALELKGFLVELVTYWTFLNADSVISKSLTFAG